MGQAFKFGDNIDTDVILPGQYLSLSAPEELAKVCMEGYEKNFMQKVRPGDIFVAGKNFGCGSSREHAPISLKAAGISCIIAESFARIFYRNAINIGLPVLESKEAAASIENGNEILVDYSDGIVKNISKNEEYAFAPFPGTVLGIINSGGMVEYVKNKNK